MQVANTLAYYDTAIITAVKKFYSTGPQSDIFLNVNAISKRFKIAG
jgi:hypothetical protein